MWRTKLGLACGVLCIGFGIAGSLTKTAWPFLACIGTFYVSDLLLRKKP